MHPRSSRVFLISGAYAALCVPGIFICERYMWSQSLLHSTQWIAVSVCSIASARFLWTSRGKPVGWRRPAAYLAGLLSGLYLLLILYVFVSYDIFD